MKALNRTNALRHARVCGALLVACWAMATVFADRAEARHALAMHGAPTWPADFKSVPYANPDAPKGGRLLQGVLGSFDSLNPLIVKGLAAQSIRGYVIESLLARGYDEPFTLYGLVANDVETDDARSFVTFTIDPRARFSDGKPITPDDVIFSWALLRDKGRPNHRTYYSKVKKAEIVGANAVRFDLSGADDRELPLILGLMPVLPKHAIDPDKFEETSFTPPVGSGPYVVSEVQPGRSVTFKRDPNYWGRDLPIYKGFWNFDEIRFDYYRDGNSYQEAFKKGLFDVRAETDPGRWQTGYDGPALRAGKIVKDHFGYSLPKPLKAYVFNTRRAIFADVRVREALAMLFDFEWTNHNFFFDLYRRNAGYFDDSELSSIGRKADERERALLAPFPGAVRADVMDGTWLPPKSDASGRDRETLKKALTLLSEAGYDLVGNELRERATDKPFTFEILVVSKDQERLAIAYARDLKRAGIEASIRSVDPVQFDRRKLTYDFDMIEYLYDQSLSPGNEQTFYWGAAAAQQDGTRNYMGAREPAIDAMIAALLNAHHRDTFVSAVRALDRALISKFYVVPLFYLPEQWVARWSHIGRPERTSAYGYLPETWWRKPSSP